MRPFAAVAAVAAALHPTAAITAAVVHPSAARTTKPRALARLTATTVAPRWFDPLQEFGLDEPRPDPERLPLLLVLPGADGSGITAWMQFPSLAQEYDVRALTIPSADRSSHDQLVKLVTQEVAAATSSVLGSREIFLLGESMGAGVAIDAALALEEQEAEQRGAELQTPGLAGLLLVSPATGWHRKWGYKVLTWRDSVLVSDRGPWPALLHAVLTLSSYELLDAAQVTSTFRRLLTGEKSPLLQGEARTEYAWRVVSQLPARLAIDPSTASHRKAWAEPTFAAGRRVSELRVPVLCIAGTADLRVPAEEEARRFEHEVPSCRCVYVAGAGHAGATDDRLDLRAELATWRRDVIGRRATRALKERSAGPRMCLGSPAAALQQPCSSPAAAAARAAVIGAGPAGLATAIMLARRGHEEVDVFERLSAPAASDDVAVWRDAAKFYLVGLGGRGQKALQELGAWERVQACCTPVLGRKDWAPGASEEEGVERIFGDDRPYKTAVIARDRLAGVLREIALDTYGDAIRLHYDTIASVRWDGNGAPLVATTRTAPAEAPTGQPGAGEGGETHYDLLVGADGAARTLASAIEADASVASSEGEWWQTLGPLRPPALRVVRYADDNERVYKTIPMSLPKTGEWRGDVNYSARTKDGRVVFDALPASAQGEYCAVLLLKAEDQFAQACSDPAGLRRLLDESLPQFSPLISDDAVQAVAAKPPSGLPAFRYVGPILHKGTSTVLLGDTIHTVKPYCAHAGAQPRTVGLGVNSAFEDVVALRTALDDHPLDTGRALEAFSTARAGEAAALVRISRELDRPGFLGFVTFILPIILDGIFHGALPQVFGPNTIALLQRDGITFQGVARRKRLDRALQVATLAVVASVSSSIASGGLQTLAPGLNDLPAVRGLGLGLCATLLVAQILRVWEPGMAPADVLAKTLQPVTDVISAEDRGTVTDGAAASDEHDADGDEPLPKPPTTAKREPLPFFGKGGLPLL